MAAPRYFWGRVNRVGKHDPSARIEAALYFCSNFAPSPFVLDDKHYATAEHYYQAAKFAKRDPALAERVRTAPTPTLCKRIAREPGTRAKMSAKWDAKRVKVMRRALDAKFRQNPALRAKLIATAPAVLHEDAPGDKFWGVCGEDQLGKLLVELRAQLMAPPPSS